MKKRYFERKLFDLPPKLRRACGNGSVRSVQRQVEKERLLKHELEKPFEPVFRFAVASDLHIEGPDRPCHADRLTGLFRSAYRYADAHPSYRNLDAVLFVGDVVNSGTEEEYECLLRVIQEQKRDGTRIISVMGNHEYHKLGHEGYVRYMEEPLEKHVVLGGYHFIGLSTDPIDTWHTLRQVRWLRRELKNAAADGGKKPIFTMQHGHIWKTVYVSRSWYTQMSLLLHLVYSRYPQIVNFSGHSHGPINHPLTVWQKRYTLFGTGTLSFFEMERDICDTTTPDGCDQAAQYLIVELDRNDRIRVMPYNILTDDFMRAPATDEHAGSQLIYQINTPWDRDSFVYTAERRKTDPPPVFAPDAAIGVSRNETEAITVCFPQARSPVCVYGYRVIAAPVGRSDRDAVTREIYSDFYLEPTPETCTCTLCGLKPQTEYEIRVIPLNVWRTEGEPLIARYFMQ